MKPELSLEKMKYIPKKWKVYAKNAKLKSICKDINT